MTERTTVRLPASLMKRARSKAARDGRTFTALVEEGLRLVLDAPVRPKGRQVPPVSKASGGVMPGIDLVQTSALFDVEDRETLERGPR